MLQPIHKCREKINVLRLYRRQLELSVRLVLLRCRSWRRRREVSLFQLFGVPRLLLFHIVQTCRDCRLEIRILFLFLLLRRTVRLSLRFRLRQLTLRNIASAGVSLVILQAHLQCLLQVRIEAIFNDASTSRLHSALSADARILP